MRLCPTRQGLVAAAAASALLMTAACGGNDSDADQSSSSPNAAKSSQTPEAGSYRAGTYEANGSYSIPSGGRSNVDVSVTLTDSGEITDITVTPKSGGTSAKYQSQFAGGIAAEAEGVNIADLNVTKVSGSSLTSGGFREAIEDIKAEAQS